MAPSRPSPSVEAAREFLGALASAERPIIVCGTGCVTSGAGGAIDQVSRHTGIPVVTNSNAPGLLPSDHPYYCGPAGTLAALTMAGGPTPDLIVLAGARAGLLLGGRSGSIIPKAARLLQIDIEASEIGRMSPVENALVADCAEAFKLFNQLT